MTLLIKRNQGFAWHNRGGLYVKGFLFDGKGTYFHDEDILNYFAGVADTEGFYDKLREANGCFAIILETNEQVLAAVDPVRSIPLFYAMKGDNLVLGDDVRAIQTELGGEVEYDPIAREELLRVGYAIGSNTLDSRVQQIEAGEVYVFDKQASQGKAELYFSHAHGNYTDKCMEEFVEELDEITTHWARRLIRSVEGRPIVVPLSGGYDSRYIVCALKRENYENVICFSYGAANSPEHHVARQVASHLGHPLHIIEYNLQSWRETIKSARFLELCQYSWQQCAIPFIQEYHALEELSKREIIPADSVVTPGYCGDLQGGSYVPPEVCGNHPDKPLAEGLDNYLYRLLFKYYTVPITSEMKRAILGRIRTYTSRFQTDDIQDYCSVLEDWFTRHKAVRFIVNNVRTYELYGYEWRLPLWDTELIEWWYRIPLKLRINSVLYHRYLFERLFDPMDVGFRKPSFSTLSLYKNYVRPCVPHAIIQLGRRLFKSTIGKRHPNPVDINAFQEATPLITNQLTSEYDRSDFASVNGAVAAWCLCHDL